MANIKTCLKHLTSVPRTAPSHDELKRAFGEILSGEATDAQIGAFLVALKAAGETAEHLAACAEAMNEVAIQCPLEFDVYDIVGTGGDGHGTFNVSTAAAIVAGAAGVRVGKHGNRSASSPSGSADVLEALGARIAIGPEVVRESLSRAGFCFLFAQTFHPLLKRVGVIRRELGVRTIFNLIGPLCNPARPRGTVVGVASRDVGAMMAQALVRTGVKRGMVVCGSEGLDEISPAGVTHVWRIHDDGSIRELSISPTDFGLPLYPLEAMVGGSPTDNAGIMRAVFAGTRSPIADFVVMNAAALIHVAGLVPEGDYKAAAALARAAISDGRASKALEAYVAASNGL